MSKIIVFAFLALIPLSYLGPYIPGEKTYLPSKSFVTINDEKYYGIGKEYPSLNLVFKALGEDDERFLFIKKLKYIIGYLPDYEQIALYNAAKVAKEQDSSKVFDSATYEKMMNNGGGYDKQFLSLKQLIASKERKYASSMGCLKSAANRFAFNSFEDDKVVRELYKKIGNINEGLKNVAEHENNFALTLVNQGIKMRATLIDLDLSGNNLGDFCKLQNEELIIDKKKVTQEYCYLKRNENDTVVQDFQNFYKNTQTEFKEIHNNAIEAMITVANLKGCIEEQKDNDDAGKSSDKYSYQRTQYKYKKLIGVNGAYGIRNDNKTQNNYSLEHAFGYGRNYSPVSNREKRDKKSYYLDSENIQSPDWIDRINDVKNLVSKMQAQGVTGIDLQSISAALSQSQFNPRSVYDVINNEDDRNKQVYRSFFGKDDNNCTAEEEYIISSKDGQKISRNVTNLTSTFSAAQATIEKLDSEPYLVCELGNRYLFTLNDGQLESFMYNGTCMAKGKSNIIQACFASFSSAGKDDKDACRGTLTKKCGIALDHQCKLSGFYDFINEIPISSLELPKECTDGSCYEFIDRYFFLGGVIPRSTMFMSYGLLGQSQGSYKSEKLNMEKDERYTTGGTEKSGAYQVQNDNDYSLYAVSNLENEVDRAYAILYSGSFSLKASLLTLLLLLGLLL